MSLELAKNAAGDYAVGFTVDGAFVPVANVAAHRIDHLVERAATLSARAGDVSHEGHEQAKQAIEDDWQVVKPASSSPSSSSSTPPAEPVPPAEPAAPQPTPASELQASGTESNTETTSTGEGA